MEDEILRMMKKNTKKATPPPVAKTSPKKQLPKQVYPKQAYPETKSFKPLVRSPVHQYNSSRGKPAITDKSLIPGNVRSSVSYYLGANPNVEIEASFGNFVNNKYEPGVSAYQFNILVNKLLSVSKEKGWEVTKEKTHEELDQKLRVKKITLLDEGAKHLETRWQVKKRDSKDNIDNQVWGFRITRSTEEHLEQGPKNFNGNFIRNKDRITFAVNDKRESFYGVRFDLTKVEENGKIKYEVEIERFQKMGIESFENAIGFIIKIMHRGTMLTLSEYHNVVNFHNDLFGKSGMDLFSNYWNKPSNIKVDDLLNTENQFSVTIKVDGVRTFILSTPTGNYACLPPFDLYKIDGNSKYTGSLFDAEMYEHENGDIVYYVFDCLFFKGVDYREKYFVERLKKVEEFCGSSKIFIAKTFYSSKDFYQNVNDALEEAIGKQEEGVVLDGLIFQSHVRYHNKFTRKWKPEENLTIDFTFINAGKDNYELHVGTEKGLQPFLGSKKHKEEQPFIVNVPGGKLTMPNSAGRLANFSVDNAIIECAYVNGNFVPERFRNDKDAPNFITTATSVWDDIKDPITEDTIRGHSLIAMRRFHNLAKRHFLNTTFKKGQNIMDWGSGRGGDISKWRDLDLGKVLVFEPNSANFEEFQRREKDIGWKNHIFPMAYNGSGTPGKMLGAQEADEIEKTISSYWGSSGIDLDGIVTFFSLTFFGKSKEMYDGMIDTIDRNLPIGGKFLGIVMDGERVENLLGSKKEYDCPSFSIKKRSKFVKAVEQGKNKIRIKIKESTSMVDQEEWLFYFDILVEKLKEIGIELVSTGFLDETSPKLSVGKSRPEQLFKMLNEDGKVFSSLNRYFTFKRVKPTSYISNKSPVKMDKTVKFKYNFTKSLFSRHDKTEKTFSVIYPTLDKDTSFIQAVLYSFDTKYRSLSIKDRESYVNSVKRMMAAKIDDKLYESIYGNTDEDENNFNLFKLNIMDQLVFPATVYADVLSKLLKLNILIIEETPKKLVLDEERGTFGCYKNTIVIYGKKELYGVLTDVSNKKIYTCYKTDSMLIKRILKCIVDDVELKIKY